MKDIESLRSIKKDILKIDGVDNDLAKIITSYIEKHPLNEKLFDEGFPKQSYYVGFIKSKTDTLLGITKQPFLFDNIFPEYIFTQKPNHIDFSKVENIPHLIGQFSYHKNPIMIFDTNENVGINFYEISKMDKVTSLKEYNYRTPIKGDIWHPKKFEVWKYKINGRKIIEVD